MPPVEINYIAVIFAAVFAMVLGFIWYGPLFGKQWIKLMGITKEKMEEGARKGMSQTYLLTTVGALVTAYVLAHFVYYVQADSIAEGMQTGFWSWLGFIAPVMLASVLYEGKSWNLYFINIGYQLASLLFMGAVLAVWI